MCRFFVIGILLFGFASIFGCESNGDSEKLYKFLNNPSGFKVRFTAEKPYRDYSLKKKLPHSFEPVETHAPEGEIQVKFGRLTVGEGDDIIDVDLYTYQKRKKIIGIEDGSGNIIYMRQSFLFTKKK